ncbi:hypothetical protein P4O66_004202 [Electrophorus voltai]|uniref:Reverse transcriptase domain-containing protein n=1 Tax=Electrophorus voltai TaxID=2609070 RepID=A0AAD8ZS82_9TELE|nr:hypothetical protein P4O66_004202 [Electrophorus voltai]
MADLTILTSNVRGLQNAEKRAAVFQCLASSPSAICCLQEVHLRDRRDEALFAHQWKKGKAYWSVGGVRSSGVGILLGDPTFEKVSAFDIVPGRAMGVDATWRGQHLRVLCAYAPVEASSRIAFFDALVPSCVTHRHLFWQKCNPRDPGHTWHNSRGASSRLDYILASPSVTFKTASLTPRWYSDHLVLEASASINAPAVGRAWRGCKDGPASPAAWWEHMKEWTRALITHYCRRRKAARLGRVRDVERQLKREYAGRNNGGELDLVRVQALKDELRVLHERVRQAREERCFTSLRDSEGHTCSDPAQMMEVSLPSTARDSLEAPFTLAELTGVLGKMNRRPEIVEVAEDVHRQDVKIFAKALTERLKKAMDAISWVEDRNVPLALVSLDQEKAFDRVDHRFLERVLIKLGELVPQVSGVRQRCPLSPLLYALYIEPLAAAIRAHPEIDGLPLPGGGGAVVKLAQYADDTTLFVCSDQSLRHALDMVRSFGKASGAALNLGKSVAKYFGCWRHRRDIAGGLALSDGPLKILGVHFTSEGAARVNWAERLAHARKKLGLWKSRSLSFLGKVLALKADVLPSLLYLAHVYPMPRSMRRGLTKDVFNLVWGGKYEYVKREVMYLGKDKGGRDVSDFPLKLDCLFFAQLCARLAAPLEHPHQYFIRLWLSWPLRKVVRTWSNSGPKAETLPEHFDHMVRWSKSLPAGLRPESLAKHRLLYKTVLEARGTRAVVGLEEDTWSRVQPKGLDNRLQDLNWRCIHGKLPVRDVLYRHGLTRHPRCPRPNCAEEETLRHVFWDCGYARDVWGKVADLCRTLDPQFQLTYNKVTWGWPQDTRPSFAPRMWELAQLVRTAEQRPLEHRPGTAEDLEDLRRISGLEPATGEQMADGGSPDGRPQSPGLAGGASAEAPEPGRTTPTEPGLGAGGGGLLNTARFRWENPGDGTVFTERVLFIREVLFGALGLTPGDLICAQRNGPLGFYDVTLSTVENYRWFLDRRVELQHHPVGKYYVVDPLWDGNRRVVTTHVFNPHVPTDLIRRFLQEYGTVHPGERKVWDELGIWNGRRQYKMSFREDGKGGLVHPPALFAIDGNRGYLFYRDQPIFCRSCRGHGHKMEDCPELECLNCLEKGHLARDCRGPRRCRRCRSEGHLARSCPGSRTYAAAVVRGTRGGSGTPGTGWTIGDWAAPRDSEGPGSGPEEDESQREDPRGGLVFDEGEEGCPGSSQRQRTPYSTRPAEGGPPRTREAAGVGEWPFPRLQDRPEMATAGAGTAPRSTAQAAEAPAETPTTDRASLAEPGLRAGSGLLNAARFRWRDPQDGTCFTERDTFIREVLFGGFGLNPGALICAQRNGAQKYFGCDVCE